MYICLCIYKKKRYKYAVAHVAAIEYDDLGTLAALPAPTFTIHPWLAELRAGLGVPVSETVHRTPCSPGGPHVSFLDGRAALEVYAVRGTVVAAAMYICVVNNR